MRQRQRRALSHPKGVGIIQWFAHAQNLRRQLTSSAAQGSVNTVSQTRKRRLFPCAWGKKKPKPKMCLNTNITPGRSAPSLRTVFSALPLEEASKVSGIHILSCIKDQFWSFFIISLLKEKKITTKPTNKPTNRDDGTIKMHNYILITTKSCEALNR